MTILDYIQETISEIRARRARIAELGGDLVEDDYLWESHPAQQTMDFIFDAAALLRKHQESLERQAMMQIGTYAQPG